MKKSLLGIIVIVFSIFVSLTITETALGYFFGGHILLTEAPEISAIDGEYDCELQGGSTIQVWSPMGTNSYFIPNYAYWATDTTPTAGQQILGIYEGETNIVCTRDENKGNDGDSQMITSQINIILPNISYGGTSIR